MLEADETFTVSLTVSGTTLGSRITATDTGTGTIDNDDSAAVTVNDASASEGNSMTFTVTLSEAVQGGLTVTPDFTDVTATEGTDYDENTTALSFSGTKGETKTFTVSTDEDAVLEADETFTVGLTVSDQPTGTTVTATDTGTGTINDDDSAAVTVNDAEADEGDGITFTVTLSEAVQGGLKVTPSYTNGTAASGDYTANTTALSFTGTKGETQTFTVSTTEDAVLEADETFTVGLTVSDAPTGTTVTATDTGTGTIDNDDGATVTVNDAEADEGDGITFTVTLGAAVQGGLKVTPGYTNGTAAKGDYSQNTNALTFTGTANETKTFTVSTTEDAVLEADETFTVDLTVSGTSLSITATDTGTGTIDNDDSAAVTIDDANADEGNEISFTVTLSEAVQDGLTVTPGFTDGTAVEGTDYDENTTALTFTGTKGETQTFTVSTTEDVVVEGNETFTVGLTVSGTSLGVTATDTGTGTINNDDGAVVTVNNAEASEGDDITFTVTLGKAVQGGLTVTPSFTDVTAVEGTDYVENTTALTFTGTKDETKTFTVSTTEDDVFEGNETFTVKLSSSNSSVTATDTGTGTINNDDSAAVTVNDARADEGDAMTFTVTLDKAVQGGLTVTPGYTNGTAADTDYTANTTALTFTGTANETKTFTVQTTEDTVLEADETFTVGLSVSDAPTGVTSTDTGTGTIDNDDGSGVIVDDADASEGESMTFTVTLTEAVQGGLTVTPGFTNGTASSTDYTENTTPLNFSGTANETKTFEVSTTGDTVLEGNETFTVDLTVSGTSLDVADTDTGTGTIIDDDSAPSVSLSVNPASVGEGDGAVPVTVTATFSNSTTYTTDRTVTVSVGGNADGATSGTDYGAVSDFTITIAAGRTSGSAPFTLTPVDDTLVEGNETITVSGTNETLTVGGTSLTLTDDDSVTAASLVIDLSVDPASVAEDAGATAVTVTAEFSNVVTYATDTTVRVSVGDSADSAVSGTDYAAVAGFTVTIPAGRTSGSAAFTLTPADDDLLEGGEAISVDGMATSLTVIGAGLTLTDDDRESLPVGRPPISLAADPASATEGGGAAAVTVTATVADGKAFPEAVTVTVSVGAGGDSATSGTDYPAVDDFTITIAAGSTSGGASFTLTPADDGVVEGDETITVSGTARDVEVSGTSVTLLDAGAAAASVSDATVEEGGTLVFTVTLDKAAISGAEVTVDYATADGTATAGDDYEPVSGTLAFAAGETGHTVRVPTLDDALDEGAETLTLRLSGAVNAGLADPEGVGTITNDDELPAAWIARYGRTVARHVMGAVDARLHGGAVGPHLTIGGVTGSWPGGRGNPAGWPGGFGDGAGGAAGRFDWRGPEAGGSGWNVSAWEDPMGLGGLPRAGESEQTAREVLAESAFRWTSGASGDGAPGPAPRWTAWGSGTATRFEGRERDVTLDGEVVGATVGLDAEWERWTVGMALAWNDGRGTYHDDKSGDRGRLGSTLASVHPYLRWADERWSVWGTVGHGQGEYTAKSEKIGKTIRSDLGMSMLGAGGRRTLVPADDPGGFELALRSDAMFVWMDADRVTGYLQETRTRTSHARLLVEGGWTFALDSGAKLAPSVEVGLRHDAGDAETGLGLELGARARYENPRRGLTVEAQGRGMLAHEAEDFEVWGVSGSVVLDPGSDRRGLSFTVRPVWGEPESGTANLWEQGAAGEGTAADGDARPARLDTEIGYGVSALGGRGVFTVRSALGWSSDGARTLGLGGTLDTDDAFELSLLGERKVRAGGEPEYGVMLRLGIGL